MEEGLEGWLVNDSSDEFFPRDLLVHDSSLALDEFCNREQRMLFRKGKARGGAMSSRRRGGNRCCMGRCGMCSLDGKNTKSANRLRKLEENWSKHHVVVDVALGGNKTRLIRF